MALALLAVASSPPPTQVKHIHTVLKCVVGSTIKMGQLEGPRFMGHVVEMSEAAVRVRLELVPGTDFDRAQQSAGVCLLLGTPRPTMIKSICVVSATMGVDHILMVKVEFCVGWTGMLVC